MKKKKRFTPLKPIALSSLVALTGSAWAASPYDMPYGVQWNFMIGTDSADNPQTVAASPDGSAWITTMGRAGTGPNMTWGNSKNSFYSGNYASGYGQIGPLGQIMQANDLSALPDMTDYVQGYMGNLTMRGTTAYLGFYINKGATWANQSPVDQPAQGNPVTIAIPTVGAPQGAPYSNPDYFFKNTFDLLSSNSPDPVTGIKGGYGGTSDSVVLSDGSMVFCGRVQPPPAGGSSDKFTPGDFTGSVGYNNWVGKVAADGTLSGPAKQPSGDFTRDYFFDVAVNESNGQVFAVGYSYQGTPTQWDPDGSGPAAPYLITPTTNIGTGIGTGVLYDGSWNIVASVVWDTKNAGDRIYDVASTPDGGWVVVGFTTGNLKSGAVNPSPGTRDAYIAKYDTTGTLVWDYQSETAYYEYAGDVTVDPADGSIYVSGSQQVNTDYDPFLMKFTSSGTMVWTSVVDNSGSQDVCVDHGNISKHKVYVLSANNPSIGGVWTATTGYIPQGTDENLLQKLIPGDFNTDGFTDFADVQLAGVATKPGLLGDDTYDFNEDNDSTLADTYFMITGIMDRAVGDIHQDSAASDVDNADIGKAIGALGRGTLYIDGDIDFDGDVDATDVANVASAFTGALSPARGPALPTGTTLTYIADVGTVFLSADGAAGGVITSFQLENSEGTFVDGSFTGPTGGSFGGAYAQATANVLADSDTTLAGTSGDLSLGSIFPTGMDQAALEAYLTVAIYTGAQGTGQMQFDLVVLPTLPTAYEAWSKGFASLTDTFANVDFEGDGISTGLEYVLGGDPTVNDAASIAPTSESSGSGLVFTFRRADVANDDTSATIEVRYSTDLMTWTLAEDGVNSVSIVENDDFYGSSPGIDQVLVALPSSLEVDGKLFARLGVSGLPEALLNEDFEGPDDAGFTVVNNGTGDIWERGTPNSDGGFGGGAVTGGNGGSLKCWGTDIGNTGVYASGTDTSLISPVIDLTSVAGATLAFAEALDIFAGDLLTVNIIDDDISGGVVRIGAPIYTADDAGAITDANWNPVTRLDLAAGVGQQVRIEWRFAGDNDGSTTYIGSYIDDVVITTP